MRGSKEHQSMDPIEDLVSPFADSATNLTDPEIRQTAYEILVAACRSSGGKSLTYISQSERSERDPAVGPSPSLQRSITSTAASKVKKALGIRSKREAVDQGRSKRPVSTGELMRVQMRVSEQTDSRVRRTLLRVAAGQLGRRVELMVLPLELLQQLKASDFLNPLEYEAWQRRYLKILEAGLLMHPHLPLRKTDTASKQLQNIIRGALEKQMEVGKNNESMQVLRNIVMSLACRSFDGSSSEICHWIDGFPLNFRLYEMLLEACFDVNEETSIIEEVDEILELIKKTWLVLGLDQKQHNFCFFWILFRRYVLTGQVENDLLFAANNMLVEVQKDAKEVVDPFYSDILRTTMSSVIGWVEKRLLAYRNVFDCDNIDTMEAVVSIALLASQMYSRTKEELDVARDKVETYIRSSLRTAFAQEVKKLDSSKHLPRNRKNSISILAGMVAELAFNEKAVYSPILKMWHPHAAGVAVATLHSCYGNKLKQFVSGISELTPDAIQVLRAADRLEKDLLQIAVEDSVDSEDGGMSVIREMPPYEAEAMVSNLVQLWINTRVDRLKEWVDRNFQQEVWKPQANEGQFAPSSIEVLRIADETLEAFFLLPISMHESLLPDVITGLDRCIQQYVLKAKSGCGTRTTFVPTLPALTRCATWSNLHGVFRKKDKSQTTRKSQVGNMNGDNPIGVSQLCVRINSLQHIRAELVLLEKRSTTLLMNSESGCANIEHSKGMKFELSAAACLEGIQQLCEAIAYKVVFHDLSHVLWDGLYVGDILLSRIEPFLQELEQYLEIVSSTTHDRVRTRIITDIMKASFDGFLLVLLAGGPSRAFTQKDSEILGEDFKLLVDLFWSNGDGLPADLINKYSTTVKAILSLFHTDSETLVEQFKQVDLESNGLKSRRSLPPTSGQWSPSEPNTLLRVLCHRNDDIAARFLKNTYRLPKKL